MTSTSSPYPPRLILDGVIDPVIVINSQAEIVFMNRAVGNILDLSAGQPIAGDSHFCYNLFFGLTGNCADFGYDCPLLEILATKKETRIIRSHQRDDGSEQWLEICAVPVFDDNGEVANIIETIHDITRRKEMEISLQRYSHCQQELYRVSQEITTTTVLDKLYRHIVSHAKDLLGFDFSTFMLLTSDRMALIIHDTIGFPAAIINTSMAVEEAGLATHVVHCGHPDVVVDFRTEERFDIPQLVTERDIRSALCVPMIVENNLLGVLVGHTLAVRRFTEQEKLLYANLANQAAIAITSAHALYELRLSQERYADLFENSLDLIELLSPDGDLRYVNRAWKEILGYDDTEIKGLSAFSIIHPERRAHFQREFQRLRQGDNVDYIETVFVGNDGRMLTVEGNVSSKMRQGKVVSIQGIFRDITQRKRLEEKLEKISMTDDLTGLLNRRGFFASAAKLMAMAQRTGKRLFLLYADLDNMKLINDDFGHDGGDAALVETAELLMDTFRASDTIARIGGDEFVVLLMPNKTTTDRKAVQQRFSEALAQRNSQAQRDYNLAISIGFVSYDPPSALSIEDLVSMADRRMYENKQQRKYS